MDLGYTALGEAPARGGGGEGPPHLALGGLSFLSLGRMARFAGVVDDREIAASERAVLRLKRHRLYPVRLAAHNPAFLGGDFRLVALEQVPHVLDEVHVSFAQAVYDRL